MANYFVEYRTPDGSYLGQIHDFTNLNYGKRENEIGVLTIDMPAAIFPGTPQLDGLLTVYRQIGAGVPYADLNTMWLIREWRYNKVGESDDLHIVAYDLNHILTRRIVAYAADTDETNKSMAIDDMMKEIVDENFGASAITARDISSFLSIAGDLTAAPSVAKAFSWRPVLPVLQELAKASFENGTYLVFDIVRTGNASCEFQTFIGQRGVDNGIGTSSRIVVSQENGALVNPELLYSYVDEVTFAYVGGRGEGIDRQIAEVEDTTRSGKTPLNRIETLVEYRMSDITATLESEGDEALKAGRPIISLTGQLAETKDFKYGRDYKFGDIIVAQYNNVILNVHVQAVEITVGSGDETIAAIIRGEADA